MKRMRGRSNNRKGSNNASRNYESNGPDVKIRGTAAHIAEKYVQLARDAQAGGDPVGAENYFQHAEHYYRILAANQTPFQAGAGFIRADDERYEIDDEDEGEGDEAFAANGGDMAGAPQPMLGDDAAQGGYDGREMRSPRGGRGRDGRGFREGREPRGENREPREPREFRDHREPREPREGREQRQGRPPREMREPREGREFRQPREDRPFREPREPRQFSEGSPRNDAGGLPSFITGGSAPAPDGQGEEEASARPRRRRYVRSEQTEGGDAAPAQASTLAE